MSPGLVPEMCVGCPECHEQDEERIPLIYSLEDPVEYHIAQVSQVPILGNADHAHCVRALMQADTETIVLGGVRRPVPTWKAPGDEGTEQ